MEREFVHSSNVVSVGYSESEMILEVEFHGGSVYQYYGVPEFVYEEMMTAPSKGKFLAAQIKNQYAFSRVE
ncbi:KTSC domain-containing protein [Lujinxingia sediminis]|uniref:KTSC domain-containing protein n=1 Tax=Lujinxingia sediminis TaxID=2480984 RepID=A0ABY0CRW0_9DELT|nr:KTSC domain-containing protein [Lujinxingia sediminis]RVU43161.1 KTSC domain-containing protein [Lujinxingia sediminis]